MESASGARNTAFSPLSHSESLSAAVGLQSGKVSD